MIVGREDFYREQGYFILWVFNMLDPDQYTTKDIYVGNQKNVFVFNERVNALSESSGVLTFECHYKQPRNDNGAVVDVWECQDVTLRDLTFDRERMQAFWYDYDRAEREIQRAKLLEDFEYYWLRERPCLDSEVVDISGRDGGYEERFESLFGVEAGWINSKAVKVLDVLYAIRNTPAANAGQNVGNYRINLFALIDVMFNSQKPFLWVILWALDEYGHRNGFKDRPAFKNKVEKYRSGRKNRDLAYQRDTRYDPLFKILFPKLGTRLDAKTDW